EWFGRIHPEDLQRVKTHLDLHLAGAFAQFECEYRMLHRSGDYRWMLCRGVGVRSPDSGKSSRIAGSQTDITERKQAEEQLLHDAFHDVLTNLPNRALFVDRLEHALKVSKKREN